MRRLDSFIQPLSVRSWAWMDLNHRPLPYQGETADSTTCRNQKSTWSEHCASLRNPLVEASPRGRCYTTATRILPELAEFYVDDSYGSLVPLATGYWTR